MAAGCPGVGAAQAVGTSTLHDGRDAALTQDRIFSQKCSKPYADACREISGRDDGSHAQSPGGTMGPMRRIQCPEPIVGGRRASQLAYTPHVRPTGEPREADGEGNHLFRVEKAAKSSLQAPAFDLSFGILAGSCVHECLSRVPCHAASRAPTG